MVEIAPNTSFHLKENLFLTSKLDCSVLFWVVGVFFPSGSAAHALILMDSIMIDIFEVDLEVLANQHFPRRKMEKL